jgi:hypothetical protein
MFHFVMVRIKALGFPALDELAFGDTANPNQQ